MTRQRNAASSSGIARRQRGTSGSGRTRKRDDTPRWIWLVPPVLAILLYALTLRNGFVLDDRALILEDPRMGSLGSFFMLRSGELIVRYWSLLLDSAIWGTRPAGYHLTNLLLHAACGLMLFAYLRSLLRTVAARASRADAAALVASLLFVAHPMLTEAVDGVTHRKELLSTAFLLLALWQSLGTSRGLRHAMGVGTAVTLALFAKAPAVVFFPLVVFQDLGVRRRTVSAWVRSDLRFYVPSILGLGGYLAYRWAGIAAAVSGSSVYFGAFNPQAADLSAPTRLLTSLKVLGLYWRLLLVPWRPTLGRFVVPVRDASNPLPWAVLVLAVAALAWAWRERQRHPVASLGLAWLVLAPVPTLNILPLNFLFSERYLYLPAVGLALVAAGLVSAAGRYRSVKAVVAVPATLLLAAFAFMVTARNLDWRNESTLLAASVRDNPDSPRVAYFHALDLRRRGFLDESLTECMRALALQPRFPEAWHLAGRDYADLGRGKQAVRSYGQAIRQARDPDAAWLNDYAVALLRAGRRADALPWLRKAVERDPSNPLAAENYAQFLLLQPATRSRGIALLQEQTRKHPQRLTPWILLVETELAAGDTTAATALAARGQRAMTNDDARSFLFARMLEAQGKKGQAARMYSAILSRKNIEETLRDRTQAAWRRTQTVKSKPSPR